MGTIPCGKRILQILNDKPQFTSKMLMLEKRWEVSKNVRIVWAIVVT